MRQMKALCLIVPILALIGVPGVTLADQDTVLQVVAVDVKSGKVDKYVATVSKLNTIVERLDLKSTLRIWRATAAGDNTGTVVVAIEHPNLAAWADSAAKLSADKEWQKLIRGLDDIRTILSNSLYRELTP